MLDYVAFTHYFPCMCFYTINLQHVTGVSRSHDQAPLCMQELSRTSRVLELYVRIKVSNKLLMTLFMILPICSITFRDDAR